MEVFLIYTFFVSNGVKQGGNCHLLYFSFIYYDLLCQLRDQNIDSQKNSYFVGAVIYADDITLLSSTHNSVMALLDVYNYVHDHSIHNLCLFSMSSK